ncbi:MAG: helix-turn-helix domain-containing protein [Pseudorhodoplanes sp.]|nr:Pca regulon regulatory protein [Pseudorhodoplanes sp.]MBW7950628.1 helix-turn-helix domain-containing protein [Pseudorhodoplanes sp.]MCL4710177.1 helix-turn-helix domain-containing protein [Pseudorhodoplanes sp.]MCQ3943821.1 IclR family transcriptional regulator [Alphaproteobacteria bacterium]GIK79870.1 MAG: IclR family transcriptional regulator [Alphaproteobacteria bacterium]
MPPRNDARTDRDFMAGLGKGLSVIECFDEENVLLSVSAVAARARLSRAAARRCLLTLQRLGYAELDGGLYRLTPRVLRLGFAYIASNELPDLLQPRVDQLSGEIHESCSASILDGDEIVYIARAATKRIMTVALGIGARLPATCTSMGRVLLASLDPDEAARRIAAAPRKAFTPRTMTREEDLLRILQQVRQQGYCVTDQELEIGLVSIAVPIQNTAGKTVAALNIGTQSARFAAADLSARFLTKLKAAQKDLRPLIKSPG